MMVETFDVMFSVKSVYESQRLMTIEPITALNLLLVCELIYSAGLLGGQKHFTGWAKIATGWAIAHPVNMLSEALVAHT